ncbi:Serine/threonine-protein kinase PknB [Gimesia panareensis]|uniref:non-specific serine/threonine protein kinase n=1 Tax=Gimesia panareensis TaxID=2527978 RepID=A0A517QBM2_9PLAN|nr:serine/threonine-protein kinase [Gimesia panareensis]QDT28979.1 Serine/threonine-protein kinase PknB [Gimesia panareensis]
MPGQQKLELLRKIDAIADRFEALWSARERPQLEDWISSEKPQVQSDLLAELLAIELEWRTEAGETPESVEYGLRFPEQKQIINKVFADWREAAGLETTGNYSGPHGDTIVPESDLTPAESLSSGQLFLDRFQLQRQLGRGGFGTVYEAYDLQLGRSVALKVPHSDANSESRQRFLIEARAAGKLRHNHIVTVFDGGDAAGTLYIACELIDGKDLAHTIKTRSPSLTQIISWIGDAARGLNYAHQEGVIHRDIKPANLLVSSDNRILVADFGLARRHDDQSALTVDGSVFGTPAYMSPEQAVGETSKIGPASDQYNLGVVLYEILTGRLPYYGNNIPQILHQIQNQEPPQPRSLNPSIPEDLEAICLKAMSRDIPDRYASLQDFADDLQRWLNHEPVLARPISWTERLRRRMRRHPLIASLSIASLILLVVSGITGGLSWYRGQQLSEIQIQAVETESQLTTQKKITASQEQELKQSRQQVTQIQEEVVEKSNAADRNRYRVLMRQISEGFQRGQMKPDRLRILLDDCPQQLRDWEWFYFDHLLQPQSQVLFTAETPLRDALLSPDQTQLAIIDGEGKVCILSLGDGQIRQQWNSRAIDVQQIAWDPTGKLLAIGDKLNGLRIWNADTGKLVSTLKNQDFLFGATAEKGEYVAPEVTQLMTDYQRTRKAQARKTIEQSPELEKAQQQNAEVQKRLPPEIHNNPLLNRFTGQGPAGMMPTVLPNLEGYGWSVAFDSTGNRIAVGGDRFIQIWDLALKRRTHLLLATQNTYVTSLTFSADDRFLSAGTYFGEAVIFDLTDGSERLRKNMEVPHSHFTTAWAPDGQSFYVPDANGEVGVISLVDHLLRTPVERHRGKTTAIAISDNGSSLATAGTDYCIRIWHSAALQLSKLLLTNAAEVKRLQFLEDQSRLVSCSKHEVRVWDIGKPSPRLPGPRNDPREAELAAVSGKIEEVSIDEILTKIAISPDSRFSALSVFDTRLKVRDMATGEVLLAFPDQDKIRTGTRIAGMPRFDPQGRWLAIAAYDREIVQEKNKPRLGRFGPQPKPEKENTYDLIVWSLPRWEPRKFSITNTKYDYDNPGFLSVSQDGKYLAYSRSHELFLLGSEDFQPLWSFQTDSPIRCNAISPTSSSVAFKCANGQIQSLSIATGKIEHRYGQQGGPEPDPLIPVKSRLDLEFSPDGKLLATSGEGGTIVLWDVDTEKEYTRLYGHLGRIDSLAFHPAGTRLVTASEDQTIRLWDVLNGEEIALLSDLPRNYYVGGGLCFSKSGRELYVVENCYLIHLDAGPAYLNK